MRLLPPSFLRIFSELEMSKAKQDMMKQIEAKVARNKQFAKQASRQKTVASWVAEFFTEYEKIKKMDQRSAYHSFAYLALSRLKIQLRNLDRKCSVDIKEIETDNPLVEIQWSATFVKDNSCEAVIVFDAAAAHFQSALEDI